MSKQTPLIFWRRKYLVLSCVLALVLVTILPRRVLALNTCYAVADGGDYLVSLDKATGAVVEIGSTNVTDIEAIAFEVSGTTLFAANGGELGKLDITTGIFKRIGDFGIATNGNQGAVDLSDVDSLSWDVISGTLYGVHRRDSISASGILDASANEPDVLFQIDITTGAYRPGAFNGNDYVSIAPTSQDERDVDDIAFHPITGALFGIANNGGLGGTLIIIDKNSGAISEVGSVLDASDQNNEIDDIEGLAFFNDGNLYGSTGASEQSIVEADRLYSIDPTTAVATLIGSFPDEYDDYEALDCLTANIADDDNDGIVNSGEDVNQNGVISDDDTDGDGIPNYLDNDDDSDGVPTRLEDRNEDGNLVNDDTDGDGLANYLDSDDDNDGVLTADEDVNGDGNPANDDSDGDSIPDYLESGDTDGDGLINELDADDDGDMVATINEDANQDGKLFNDDTDSDRTPNYLDPDDDGDKVSTVDEDVDMDKNPFTDDTDGDGIPNFLDVDDDGDGFLTRREDPNGDGNPLNDDTDGDGVADWLDADSPYRNHIYMPLMEGASLR